MADVNWSDDEAVASFFTDIASDEDDFEGFLPSDINSLNSVLAKVPLGDFVPDNDVDLQSDLTVGWKKEDDVPLNAPFTGQAKLLADMARSDPIDFFKLFIDDEFVEILVTETNRYARKKLENENLPEFSRMKKWREVDREEMQVFLALVIAMGLVQKNDIQDYWSTDEVDGTPFFGKYMARDRFLLILSNFHLNDNDNAIPRGQVGFDALFKLRPFINKLNDAFTEVYQPERDLSFDEGTCAWKGRLHFRVYNPAKPSKFGIKLYQVCEGTSGYTLGFSVYTGDASNCIDYAELVGVDRECTTTTKIVTGLLARCGLLDKGHHVYMDNYYTSPELFRELNVLNTYACGTLRRNRKDVPDAIKAKSKLKQNQCIFRRNENLLAMKFHDKCDVLMLSTIHNAEMAVLRKENHTTGEPIVKPICTFDYIHLMGGVDLSDQINSYYTCLRKTVKWYKKLFFHLMNLAIVNAYLLYKKFAPDEVKMDNHKFRMSLVKTLLDESPNAPKPQPKGRKSTEDRPERLTGRHFPVFITPAPGVKRKRPARDCRACNVSKKRRTGYKRTQTSYWCPECEKPLCVPDCFKAYHTLQNYRAHLLPGNTGSSTESDSNPEE